MLHRLVGLSKLFAFYSFLSLLLPTAVFAADPGEVPNTTLPLPNDLVWALVAAGLVPLAGYLFNKYGPHTGEKTKGSVIGVLGVVSAALVQAVSAGGVGLNDVTLQYVLLGLVAAYGSHKFVWQPTTIAAAFGAGQNKPGQVPGSLQPPPA